MACAARPAGPDWTSESFFDLTYLAETGGPVFAADSFFDIFTEYRAPDGSACPLVALDDSFPVGDPRRYFDVSFTDSFFDITYEVMFNPREYTVFHARGAVAPGVRIYGATVQQPQSACSAGCDAAFTIKLDLHADDPAGCCPSSRPVLIMRETAQSNEAPVANQDRTWGSVKALFR